MSKTRKHTSLTGGVFADLRGERGESPFDDALSSAVELSRSVAVNSDLLINHLGKVDDPSAKALAKTFEDRLGGSEDLLIARMPSASIERERMQRIVDSLMPDAIPQPVELLQARRSAQMRRDMLARFGYYSAEELADMYGSAASNRYALATRWAREGRIFGVPLGARTVFPAFQFDSEGVPYPSVAEVLRALPRKDMSPWAVGLWWFANNPWLPDAGRPAELIGTQDENRTIEAAKRLAEPLPL